MTKRFTMNEDGYIWDNGEPISQETVLNRLNALYEYNEQLKNKNNKWIVEYNGLNTEYQWLKEENEQLKKRNDFLKKQLNRVCIDNETMGNKLKTN